MNFLSTLDPRVVAAIISTAISGIVALLLAIYNRATQKSIEKTKLTIQRDLEETKASISEKLSKGNARLSYEFDAKKRLYAEVDPLFFQLFHACEASYYRVASLVRSQRQGRLDGKNSWLNGDGYYLRSTIYHLFLPIAIYRLIQRSTTFVDIGIEEDLRTKFFLLKQDYFVFADDFEFAAMKPEIKYTPNDLRIDAQDKEMSSQFDRQGLFIGHLDRLIDVLIIYDADKLRTVTFGEFEKKLSSNDEFKEALIAPYDLLVGFDFNTRPVFARILLAHAYIMRILLFSFGRSLSIQDLASAVDRFAVSNEAIGDLAWDTARYREIVPCIQKYIVDRIFWISPDDYTI